MSSLFGGGNSKTPQVNYEPPGFVGGGLTGSYSPVSGQFRVNASSPRTSAVSGISGALNTYSDLLGGLRETVTPGFNSLLQSRLAQIDLARRRAVGNLRQNLQSRRVLGSSFGQDTLARAEAEFGNLRQQTAADNFLKSLEANRQLLQEQYNARVSAFQNSLNELNFEAGLASGLAKNATDTLAQNARANAALDAQSQAGAGKLFGSILGTVGSIVAAPFTGGASLFALPSAAGGLVSGGSAAPANSFLGGIY